VLRRTIGGEGSAKVSILPGLTANDDKEQKSHLQKFARTIPETELSLDAFATIINEVSASTGAARPVVNDLQAAIHMGLSAANDHRFGEATKRFSDDILRIELSGPEHHHLSVVDVPGLYHSKTTALTARLLNH
jgi:hypothetical protein